MDWAVQIFDHATTLPDGRGGVYLLFADHLLDYVGQSDDVARRLREPHHMFDPAVHQRIAVIWEGAHATRLILERYFNARYNPPNSFIGTEKQGTAQDSGWFALSAAERRQRWHGPAFSEFDPFAAKIGPAHTQHLQQTQVSNNALGVPSLIAFRPGEIAPSARGGRGGRRGRPRR